MIQRLTWVKLADSSQAQWLKTFHLYKGFNRKIASTGDYIKGSVRVIQAVPDPYKGFSVKRINKGKVTQAVIVRQSYQYKLTSGTVVRSWNNESILLKDDRSVLIKHTIGPCFSAVRKKNIMTLFKSVV